MRPADPDNPEVAAALSGMTPTRCNAEGVRALCEFDDDL
jgi:hypothetical protein